MHDALTILARATHSMSIAEMMQLERRRRLDQSEDDYLMVIRRKTASLIEASCEIGALANPRLREERGRLASFGLNVGMAFQIIDDVFDYEGDLRRLGKPVGGDWREGRITLPFIAAWRAAEEPQRHRILEAMQDDPDGADLWPQICAFVHDHGGVEIAYERARHYGALAKEAIAGLSVRPQREILGTAADYVLGRIR
jgi:octaprenyl-diphosphate synthase